MGTILEGSVRRSGDRVRITAQLSDANDGFQLWSERSAAFALGELKDATALVHRGLVEHDPVLLLLARHWPSFQWLRQQPEWPAMLKQLDEPPKTEP